MLCQRNGEAGVASIAIVRKRQVLEVVDDDPSLKMSGEDYE